MTNFDLHDEKQVTLKLGHLWMLWHVLSDRLAETDFKTVLSEAEQKAIWGLEDALENVLVEMGKKYSQSPHPDLIEQLEAFVIEHVDADFT